MSTAPLHLYRGQDGPLSASPSLDWTLTQVYERHLLPLVRLAPSDPRTQGTVDKDLIALHWWSYLTGDPPLREITEEVCAAFKDRLAVSERLSKAHRETPLAQNTQRSVIIHLQKLLDLCGPRNRKQPRAIGVFADVPWIECPPAGEALVKDIWRLDELGLILSATRVAKRPDWWQSLILFAYNTGLRIGTIMQATWDMVDRDEPGWLTIPKAIYKGGKRGLIIPINFWARESMEERRREDDSCTTLVFGRPWPSCKSGMERTLGRIKMASGLPPHRCRRFAFHAIRGCCYSEGRRMNSAGADLLLGHRGVSIGIDCYAGRELMLDVVGKLPQPKWSRQARLF